MLLRGCGKINSVDHRLVEYPRPWQHRLAPGRETGLRMVGDPVNVAAGETHRIGDSDMRAQPDSRE